ncbi:MAG: immunity protein YezG family protein [Sporolactobacillus sp.]
MRDKFKDGGRVFFFFTSKGEKRHAFLHSIPKSFFVDKKVYNKELHKLLN